MLAAVVASALCTAADQKDAPARLVRIDGTSLDASWVGCSDGEAIRFRGDAGPITVSADDLSSVRFAHPIEPSSFVTVFHLADGGKLFGELIGDAGDALTAHTLLSAETRLPFSRLAGVRLIGPEGAEKSSELFDAAMAVRLPGQDVLVTRGPDEIKALRGRLDNLGPVSGSFVYAEKSRGFQNDKIFGVVFAEGVAKDAVLPVTVELIDGSVVSGTIESSDPERLHLAASFGATIDLPLTQVHRLEFHSPRVRYLSDLPVAAERLEGRLHRPWPIRRDRSVANGPLSLDGRVFDKGLGVHARTELDFDLGGSYETLVATVGIDDAVRPQGLVEFRVLGDGKELCQSVRLGGEDSAKDIHIDVAGVKTLTLVADYADGVDLSDQADWGGARLLKAGGKSP